MSTYCVYLSDLIENPLQPYIMLGKMNVGACLFWREEEEITFPSLDVSVILF